MKLSFIHFRVGGVFGLVAVVLLAMRPSAIGGGFDPALPRRVGGYDTLGTAHAVTLTPAHALVADGEEGLLVLGASGESVPPRVLEEPADQTAVVGATATFTLRFEGLPTPWCQWQKADSQGLWQTLAFKTNELLRLDHVQFADAGDYRAVLSNSQGAVTSRVAMLTVVPAVPVTYSLTGTLIHQFGPDPSSWGSRSFAAEVSLLTSTPTQIETNRVMFSDAGGLAGSVSVDGRLLNVEALGVTFRNEGLPNQPPHTDIIDLIFHTTEGTLIFALRLPAGTHDLNIPPFPDVNGVEVFNSSSVLHVINTNAADNTGYAIDHPVFSNFLGTTPDTPPVITSEPEDQTVPVGATATFTLLFTGKPTPQCQWQKADAQGAWASLPGQTSNSLLVANVVLADAGDYRAVLTNSQGTATSRVAVLTVFPTNHPARIAVQPKSQAGTLGSQVHFSVVAQGDPELRFQWRKGGIPLGDDGRITGALADRLTLAGLTLADAGLYSVTVSNAFDGVISEEVLLTVWTGTAPGDAHTSLYLSFDDTLRTAAGEEPAEATGVDFVPGMIGSGAWFSGTNRLIYNSAGKIFASQGTLEFWIKPQWNGDDGESHCIASWGVANGAVFTKDSANNLRSIFNRWGILAPELGTVHPVGYWRSGIWRHVAFSWKSPSTPGTTLSHLYVDGRLIVSDIAPRLVSPPTTLPGMLRIGGEYDWGNGNLRAVLDELTVSDVQRTHEEIAERYRRVAQVMAPRIVAQPLDQTNAIGATAVFTVRAAGDEPFRYFWFKEGAPLMDAESWNNPLVVTNVRPIHAGGYVVIVTNWAGAVTSRVATLVVQGGPTPPPPAFGGMMLDEGFLVRDLWQDSSINGSLESLQNLARFPGQPDFHEIVRRGESQTDWGDHYGQKLWGLLVPEVTGIYSFALASDDAARLSLSRDREPFNMEKIAVQSARTAPHDWKAWSTRLYLQAGHEYYLEALMAENDGADHLAVGWILPGTHEITVIPGRNLRGFCLPNVASLAFTHQPVDQTVYPGTRARFSVGAVATSEFGNEVLAYQWQSNRVDIPGATGPSYETPFLVSADSGNRYRCVVDIPGLAPMASTEATVTVIEDLSPLEVVAVTGNSTLTEVVVVYSKPLDPFASTNTQNYTLDGGLTKLWARLLPDQKSVVLVTSPQTPGATYTLGISGVRDLFGMEIAAGTSRAFTAAMLQVGSVTREVWRDRSIRTYIDSLLNLPRYRDNLPDERGSLTRLEAPTNEGDYYGQRISGSIIPPATGDYRFHIAADDYCRLYLATNDTSSLTSMLIASHDGWTYPREWGKYPSQASAPVRLEAGRPYRFQALMTEELGGDNLAVGWTLPGQTNIEVIGGAHLGTFMISGGINITQQPLDQTVAAGATAQFEINATLVPGLGDQLWFQWLRDGRDILNATGKVYVTRTLSAYDSGSRFRCRVSAPGVVTALSAEATLTVGPALHLEHETVPAFLATPAPGSLAVIPVVVVKFLPTADGLNLDATKMPDYWSMNPITLDQAHLDIEAFTKRTKFILEEGSRFRAYDHPTARPSLGYRVVDVITIYEHTPPGRFSWMSGNGVAAWYLDYEQIMRVIDGRRFVDELGVREFWVWHGYFDGNFPSYDPSTMRAEDARAIQESNMSSPLTGDISNSGRFDDLPVYGSTYTVYECNLRRTHNEALENHAHQIEALLSHAFTQAEGNADTFWEKFVGQDSGGQFITGRCGWSHMPPNTTSHYDWFNPAVVSSDIQDWRPDGSGARQSVSADTWAHRLYPWPDGYQPGQDSALWFVFWMQSMPGFDNGLPYGSGTMRNWWEYLADWDRALTTGTQPPEILRQPASRGVLLGASVTFDVEVSGGEPLRFQWRRNDQDIAGATSSSLTLSNVTAADVGAYAVEICNLAGAARSVPADLALVNALPVIEGLSDRSLPEDVLLELEFGATDHETATADLELTGLSSNPAVVPSDHLVFHWTGTTWSLQVMPLANQSGQAVLTIRARDEENAVGESTFVLTVLPQNDRPTLPSLPVQWTAEGSLSSVDLAAVDLDLPADTLFYQLVGQAPPGAAIDSASGRFTWIPTEVQGPGIYTFTVQVTDDGEPAMSDTTTLVVEVAEVNTAPVPPVLPDQPIPEGTALVVEVAALDPDQPANALTYAFEGEVPGGALLDPITGRFSWTPSEGQGPGTYTIGVRVTDDGAPVMSAATTFRVVVSEVNAAPSLAAVPTQHVAEGGLLTVDCPAVDLDQPANHLRYSLVGSIPDGAVLDVNTGRLTWTPNEIQGPATYSFTVQATDDGTPPRSGTTSFSVIVSEVNSPPALTALPDQNIGEGTTVTLDLEAIDVDRPHNILTFSIDAPAPDGATMDPYTGRFTWTPAEGQGPGEYLVTVRVSDNGSPVLSSTVAFRVGVDEVNTAPSIGAVPVQYVPKGASLSLDLHGWDSDQPTNRLTFEADGPLPDGAAFDPATGHLAWTPTEEQGPRIYTLGFGVRDDGVPPLSNHTSFQVVVGALNSAPGLPFLAELSVMEESPLVVSLAAIDTDQPRNTLTYALDEPVPAGASIDAATGLFSWTPTEAQGPSTNLVTVSVTDNGEPPLSHHRTYTIVVGETNRPPALPGHAVLPRFSTREGWGLTVGLQAVDPDLPANVLTYRLEDPVPQGALMDPVSGNLQWTPTESQGPGTYTITASVTDDGVPPMTMLMSFEVTVTEVNEPPRLVALPEQEVRHGQVLTLDLRAADADLPANVLTFGLQGLGPEGAALDPETGRFEWAPSPEQTPSTNIITFTVTDDGTPPLVGTQSVTIRVVPPEAALKVTATSVRPGAFTLSWVPKPGRRYKVQCRESLGDAPWQDLPAAIEHGTCTDTAGGLAQRFYRVVELE